MFIRYFARTDESELGRLAASYCDAIVATGLPVRLVSVRLEIDNQGRASSVWGKTSSCWEKHRELISTPMEGSFVNVVCTDVEDWMKLWTAGCTNILLVADENVEPRNSQLDLMDAVSKYDHVIVTSSELAEVVERVTGLRPVVVKLGDEFAGKHLRLYFA